MEDTWLCQGTPNAAAPLTGRASDLCWRDAKQPVNNGGVIGRRTTAWRWQSYLAADRESRPHLEARSIGHRPRAWRPHKSFEWAQCSGVVRQSTLTP